MMNKEQLLDFMSWLGRHKKLIYGLRENDNYNLDFEDFDIENAWNLEALLEYVEHSEKVIIDDFA